MRKDRRIDEEAATELLYVQGVWWVPPPWLTGWLTKTPLLTVDHCIATCATIDFDEHCHSSGTEE